MSDKEFSIEKILTVSAGDYARSTGLSLDNFNPVGIHLFGEYTKRPLDAHIPLIQKAAEEKNATVVVDYKLQITTQDITHVYFIVSATALVPKAKPESK